MPDVVNLNRDEAEQLLESRGLQVSFTEREDETKDPGTVLAMTPGAGAEVEKGTTVTLTIAKEPTQVAVPSVVDDEVNDAVDALEEAGFRVRQREAKVDNPDDDGIVSEQDPPAGEKRDRSSRVVITVGRFEPEEPRSGPGRNAGADPHAVRVAVWPRAAPPSTTCRWTRPPPCARRSGGRSEVVAVRLARDGSWKGPVGRRCRWCRRRAAG